MSKRKFLSTKAFFIASFCLFLFGLILYLNACPTVSGLSASPARICDKGNTTLSFTADWSGKDCLEWDDDHTVRLRYQKDGGDWSNWQTSSATISNQADTSIDGSLVVYASAGSDGYSPDDNLPFLDGAGSYSIEVEAKGKTGGTEDQWGDCGTVTLTVVRVESITPESPVVALGDEIVFQIETYPSGNYDMVYVSVEGATVVSEYDEQTGSITVKFDVLSESNSDRKIVEASCCPPDDDIVVTAVSTKGAIDAAPEQTEETGKKKQKP